MVIASRQAFFGGIGEFMSVLILFPAVSLIPSNHTSDPRTATGRTAISKKPVSNTRCEIPSLRIIGPDRADFLTRLGTVVTWLEFVKSLCLW